MQGFDKVIPGSVIWRRVSKPKEDQELSRFKAVENTNYAVDLAKSNGMHIVGIQGSDIVDGTRTLVLGLVWQLMRLSINQTLASISKNGKGVTDSDMVKWANDKVKQGGKTSTMRSFKDPSLSNAVFFLDLLNAIKPGYVDYSLVNQGSSDEDKRQNGMSSPSPQFVFSSGFQWLQLADAYNSQARHFDCTKDERLDLPRPRG